jgi:hypothetical protein
LFCICSALVLIHRSKLFLFARGLQIVCHALHSCELP